MLLAFMMRDLQLPCVASHACTNILVSASSWLHGATASSDIILLLMVSSFVTTTMLAVSVSHSLSSITWNSSVFLFSSCKKLLQFVGALLVSVTLILILAPLFWVTSNQVELLAVIFQHLLLWAASSLLEFEESHCVPLDWFVERAFSFNPHALLEWLELLLASLLMCPNQFSKG